MWCHKWFAYWVKDSVYGSRGPYYVDINRPVILLDACMADYSGGCAVLAY